jgi:hypothetical protein
MMQQCNSADICRFNNPNLIENSIMNTNLERMQFHNYNTGINLAAPECILCLIQFQTIISLTI